MKVFQRVIQFEKNKYKIVWKSNKADYFIYWYAKRFRYYKADIKILLIYPKTILICLQACNHLAKV